MCDRCKTIFSENDEGWQSFTANTMNYDENGQVINVPIRQDLCADCAIDTPRRGKATAERDESIRQLEETNARLDKLTEQIEQLPTTPVKPPGRK